MIRLTYRYDQYAYSVPVKISDALLATEFEEGQWIAPGENGWGLPTAGAKAFMLISSRRPGRNQFAGKVDAPAQVYMGPFALATDQVDAEETYAAGDALYVTAKGLLTNEKAEGGIVVAYATGALEDGFLPIVSA